MWRYTVRRLRRPVDVVVLGLSRGVGEFLVQNSRPG
jgi:hypothetical protein